MAAAALLLSLPTAVFAQADVEYNFDEVNQQIEVVITGGSTWMVLHTDFDESCVGQATAPDSVNGSGTIILELECLKANGSGYADVQVCMGNGGPCFDRKEFYLKCDGNCHIWEVTFVPTTTEWGLIVLLVLTIASGAYLIRRRRAVATR